MKANCTFAQIAEVLRTRQRFVVLSHLRPDGDALGCELAMGLCLQSLGKDVSVWNEDGLPHKFHFLPEGSMVTKPPAARQKFDVAVVIDTAVENRIGTCHAAVEAETWINIDHHVSNNHYGDLAYIDTAAPAAGEILYELFRSEGFAITPAMRDNLYVALTTDTGSFQYPSTTARTYQIAADLVAAGVKVGDLSQKLYESYPRRRLELLRAVLNELQFTAGGRVASFSLSLETVARLGAQPEDNEGLIDYIRAVEGVVAAGFFEEMPDGKIRISLRSKDPRVDVCKVCGLFGGGGHVLAAGARSSGTLATVRERVLQALAEEVATLPASV